MLRGQPRAGCATCKTTSPTLTLCCSTLNGWLIFVQVIEYQRNAFFTRVGESKRNLMNSFVNGGKVSVFLANSTIISGFSLRLHFRSSQRVRFQAPRRIAFTPQMKSIKVNIVCFMLPLIKKRAPERSKEKRAF